MIYDEARRAVGANLTQKLDEVSILADGQILPAALFIFAPEVNLATGGQLILHAEVGQAPRVSAIKAVGSVECKPFVICARVVEPKRACRLADKNAKAAVLDG